MTRAEKQTRRIARLLTRALRHGEHAGAHWEKKKALLKKAQALGLALGVPITLENGEEWQLQKPEGHFVYYHDVDLKRVPKFKRAGRGDSPQSPVAAATVSPAEPAHRGAGYYAGQI